MTIKDIITSEKFKGAVAIAAAVAMIYTPDEVDRIIELCLAYFGISKFVLKKEE